MQVKQDILSIPEKKNKQIKVSFINVLHKNVKFAHKCHRLMKKLW